jgi:hypothetical protein
VAAAMHVYYCLVLVLLYIRNLVYGVSVFECLFLLALTQLRRLALFLPFLLSEVLVRQWRHFLNPCYFLLHFR